MWNDYFYYFDLEYCYISLCILLYHKIHVISLSVPCAPRSGGAQGKARQSTAVCQKAPDCLCAALCQNAHTCPRL